MWVCGFNILDLDRGSAQRGERERDACVRAGDLTLGLHQPGDAGRRNPERRGASSRGRGTRSRVTAVA